MRTADLSLRWVHTHFVGFVMSRLTSFKACDDLTKAKGPNNKLILDDLFLYTII